MATLSLFMKTQYENVIGREPVEWSNVWISSANESSLHRVLLIGDSTMRMVRSSLEKMVGMPVDFIGSSSRVDDVLFINLCDYFFDSLKFYYDVVFIQLGHHGRVNDNGGAWGDKDTVKYEHAMENLLGFLKQHCDKIVLESIFDSVIHKNRIHYYFRNLGLLKEKKDEEINSVTQRKNAILKLVATRNNVMWLDINKLVDEKGFVHLDHIHFKASAVNYICRQMHNKIDCND